MLRERYLAERNARIVGMLTDPNKNETERFWDARLHLEISAGLANAAGFYPHWSNTFWYSWVSFLGHHLNRLLINALQPSPTMHGRFGMQGASSWLAIAEAIPAEAVLLLRSQVTA